MTQRWDAARSASQRPLRKYKLHGPVAGGPDAKNPQPWKRGPLLGHFDTIDPLPRTMATRMSILEGLDELGMLDGANRQEAISLLLTGEASPTPEKPLSACYFGAVTGCAFHSYDCGRGEHRCALEVKP